MQSYIDNFFKPNFDKNNYFEKDLELKQYNLNHGAHVEYSSKFLSKKFSNELFDHLLQLDYTQYEKIIYNKNILTPRLMCFQGDSHSPFTEPILKIKNKLEEITNFKFNYVLINYYRNGNDYIAYNGDRESLGETRNVLCSVTIGSKRKFVMKNNITKEKIIFELENGSLLIMKGDNTQLFWKHSVPKTKKISFSRFNLTFRHS